MLESKILNLKAKKREVFGKKLAQDRLKGGMPAVLYGSKEKNQSIFVPFASFKKVWKEAGESSVIELEIDGKKKNVIINDVDIDPMNNNPRHADFYAVDLGKKITASVPLVYEGEPPAVKQGGTLVKVIHELEIEALPNDLPSELKVDVSVLETFEDKILIKDLKITGDVKILAELEEAVAFVEEAKDEVEDKTETGLEDIEVSTEKKAEEKEGEEGDKKDDKDDKEDKEDKKDEEK